MTLSARITTHRPIVTTILTIVAIVTISALAPNLPDAVLQGVFKADHQIRRILQAVSAQKEQIAGLWGQGKRKRLQQVLSVARAQPKPEGLAQLQPVSYLPMLATERSGPDAFEPDDTCATASVITPGSVQSRTFAALADTVTVVDIDIIRVHFIQAGSYDARVFATDPQLMPRVELGTICGSAPFDAFTPDGPVRLIVPSANYTLYFKVTSLNPNVLKLQNTAYNLSLSGIVNASQQANDANNPLPRNVILPNTHP